MVPSIKIDCSACKSEKAMAADSIPRFSSFIRFIGYVIVAPAVLGIIIAVIMFISTTNAASQVIDASKSDAYSAGAAVGATIGYGFSIFIGFSSLVSGLIGWLLLTKKKVYKCFNCGYVLDRA